MPLGRKPQMTIALKILVGGQNMLGVRMGYAVRNRQKGNKRIE